MKKELKMVTRKASTAKTVRTAAKKTTAIGSGSPRKGVGAPAERYFADQPPSKRALLETLRTLVMKGVPDAEVSIKWGVPFYQRNGRNVCALASFKEHVGINFFAPPGALVDPEKKLEGSGKRNRMLKVRSATDIDRASTCVG